MTADVVDRPLGNAQGLVISQSQVDAMKEAGAEIHAMFASNGLDCALFLTRDIFACAGFE